jgi:hypothetical protein
VSAGLSLNVHYKFVFLAPSKWPVQNPNSYLLAKRPQFNAAITQDGDLEMLTKTKIAFAAALVLGTASVALAGGNNDGDSHMGGFVHPPSMDGVNPAYHPGWFPGYSRGERASERPYALAPAAYAFAPNAYAFAGKNAFAYAPTAIHKHRSRR